MAAEASLSTNTAFTSPLHAMRRTVLAWPADRVRKIAIVTLLLIQAGLLAYSATCHSPTHLEPAFLVSGISHWQFGRFELYRVNPPLVRMLAALPVLAVGCETNWSHFFDGPGSRAEFPLGEDFIKANGKASIPLFIYARWACIPYNMIGAYFAYRWAMELYQSVSAGFVTLILYVFEPNLLAHGELITPDAACTAFGILAGYTFWRWLKQPTWTRAMLAGGALGLAELAKMSWLILFGLWPLLWLVWRWLEPRGYIRRDFRVKHNQQLKSPAPPIHSQELIQLFTIILTAVYLINLCYAFDNSGTQLGDFQFVSMTLTGRDKPGDPGNRFRDTVLGKVPIPLPKQYVLGFDNQKKDLEDFPQQSFLRGEWKDGGWWYYYLYGLLIKVPCGTLGLLVLAIVTRLSRSDCVVPLRDELVLLLPAASLLTMVSSQTEFNIHLRYVFPSLGLLLIFAGFSGKHILLNQMRLSTLTAVVLITYSSISTLLVYPHHLAYFNDFVGGPKNGYKHLQGSSFNWGQQFLLLAARAEKLDGNIVQYSSDRDDKRFFNLLSLQFNSPENQRLTALVAICASELQNTRSHQDSSEPFIGYTHLLRAIDTPTKPRPD